MHLLGNIKNKITLSYWKSRDNKERKKCEEPKVASIEETINEIIKNRVSVSRFGDGEYKWIADLPQDSFQDSSVEMRKRLTEIIKSDLDCHIVCLSDVFGDLSKYNTYGIGFWTWFMANNRVKWISYLKPGKQYYNTNMTRLYMDYRDKSKCGSWFQLLKKVWEDRELLIIEGEKTRLGIGNDLFHNAKSIQRILAPATNAFHKYDEIFLSACEAGKGKLILIALGPTATILAYDLAKEGYQAIDVGHVDVEYEWFLMGANEKVPLKNKYVNEAAHHAGRDVEMVQENEYLEQICKSIKNEK